jgi:hypothetical protein
MGSEVACFGGYARDVGGIDWQFAVLASLARNARWNL